MLKNHIQYIICIKKIRYVVFFEKNWNDKDLCDIISPMLVTNVGQTDIQNSTKHLRWSVLRSLKLFSQNAKVFYFQKLFSTYMETR